MPVCHHIGSVENQQEHQLHLCEWNMNGSWINLCASKTMTRVIKRHQTFGFAYMQPDNEHQCKNISVTDTWRVALTCEWAVFSFNDPLNWSNDPDKPCRKMPCWHSVLDIVFRWQKKAFTNYSYNKNPVPFLNNFIHVPSALSILEITDLICTYLLKVSCM